MDDLFFAQLGEFAKDEDCAPASRLANMTALIFEQDPLISWAGIYRAVSCTPNSPVSWRRGEGTACILDVFQGKPACMTIAPHCGVIGYAVDCAQAVEVGQVRDFPGHIACDPASQSELVIPLFDHDRLLGVLDLDSIVENHFQSVPKRTIDQLQALFSSVLALKIEQDAKQAG